MKKNIKFWSLLFLLGSFAIFSGCSDDDEPTGSTDAATARFSYEVDADNYLKVTFTNESVNADTYAWDFGDGNSSTDESPVHTFAEVGTFTVMLTATGTGGSGDREEDIIIVDPLAAGALLAGTQGKTWKLIRDISMNSYPYEVGPTDRSQIWWSLGLGQEICERACVLDDTFTFNVDGTMTRVVGDDFWAEEGTWPTAGCFDTSVAENWLAADGGDLSTWGDGTFDYTYSIEDETLTLSGAGAYMGLAKVGSTAEYTVPQSEVIYKVAKVVDATVDTLVLETVLDEVGGYWSFTFVSYDVASDEPEMPVCEVVEAADSTQVTFMLNFNDYTGEGTTPAVIGNWNGWSSAQPMTDEDGDGMWESTMTLATGDYEFKFATDAGDQEALTAGSDCTLTTDIYTNRTLNVAGTPIWYGVVCWEACLDCAPSFTAADLVGKDWTLWDVDQVIAVGPGIGRGDWFAANEAWIAAVPCLFDDTFTFDDAGGFVVNVGDSVLLEDWMDSVSVTGCVPVADIPENLAAWGGGDFTYTFTEGSETTLPTISVTGNGAYLGFYKGGPGAEQRAPKDTTITYEVIRFYDGPTNKRLRVGVDYSEAGDGSAYWNYLLTAPAQ
ncbi:MAG: PKD domain-containing protein [Cyclobacteriaceae bacterium]|jgi:PKD repeat protein|nr:hypothetical protein [Flavobacteriales bacterium]|tara:strand:+ start:4792 stop:6621 length:1830 start_codon:yes stop_codon:yes gene_type:complete